MADTNETAGLVRRQQGLRQAQIGDWLRADAPEGDVSQLAAMAMLGWYCGPAKLTQATIASRLQISQSTVSRTLAKYCNTTPLARATLQSNAVRMVVRFIKEAKPPELLKALLALRTPDGSGLFEPARNAAVTAPEPASSNVFLGVKLDLPPGQ